MDAIALLEGQHEEVSFLFEKTKRATNDASKLRIVERLADALAVHMEVEERLFYPAIREASAGPVSLQSLHEHLEVKQLIAELLERPFSDPEYDSRFLRLQRRVEAHVHEERTRLFPKVRRLFDAHHWHELGHQMDTLAEQLERKRERPYFTHRDRAWLTATAG